MIVPLDECLVADIDRDNNPGELIGEFDATLNFGFIAQTIGCKFLVGDRLP